MTKNCAGSYCRLKRLRATVRSIVDCRLWIPALADCLSPRDQVRIVRALEVQALTGRPISALQKEHAFADQPFRTLKIAVNLERSELYRRIDRRTEAMLAAGLVDEVRELLESGVPAGCKGLQTIGYREIVRFLAGRSAFA